MGCGASNAAAPESAPASPAAAPQEVAPAPAAPAAAEPAAPSPAAKEEPSPPLDAPAEAAAAEPDIVAVTKEMLDMQISMAKGEVDPAMMESFSVKMMGYFADEISWSTPTTGDSKGNFMDMMGTVGPIWMGFVNTEAVNLDCVKESDAVASMTQKYVNYLAIDGTKIEGTDRTIEVKHSLT
jgi:hypothetical protein